MYFSEEMKAIRYISRSHQRIPFNYYQLDPILFIGDYTIGVQYAINQAFGNCSIRGIRNQDDIAEDIEFEMNHALDFVMRMKSPEQFLNFDGNYSYTGQRETNGVKTDKYISDQLILGEEAIFEYSISINKTLVALDIQAPNVVYFFHIFLIFKSLHFTFDILRENQEIISLTSS